MAWAILRRHPSLTPVAQQSVTPGFLSEVPRLLCADKVQVSGLASCEGLQDPVAVNHGSPRESSRSEPSDLVQLGRSVVIVADAQNAGSALGRVAANASLCVAARCPLWLEEHWLKVYVRSLPVPVGAPTARIFTGQGLRDAFGQRPWLTWAVTARGSAYGIGSQRVG